jgi:hypothetical protein
MSILSKLVDALKAGTPPEQALATAWAQTEAWGASIIANAPAAVQTDINTAVTDVKQGLSDAVSAADTLAGPIINTGAVAVSAAFTTAVTAYLGPVASAAITPAGLDAITAIKNGLIDELNSVALELQAKLAAPATMSPIANPPAASPS